MSTFSNAGLCGTAGAIAAYVTYVQSNLFILGDVLRRGRHPLCDAVAFVLMGLVAGIVLGIVAARVFAARVFAASPLKAVLVGLGVTVLGIAAVGGASTFRQYRELYSRPNLAGPGLVLEFELRLPADRDPAGELPDVVEIPEGAKTGTQFPLSREAMRESEGRIIISGTVPLKKAAPDRLLTFPHNDSWYAIFTLLLNDTPIQKEFEWTDWQPERNPPSGLTEAQECRARYRVKLASGG